MTGAERIAAERQRQIDEEGYDTIHDEGHAEELAMAGAAYALSPRVRERLCPVGSYAPFIWPWDDMYFKPGGKTRLDRIRDLEKAGALIAAAIDDLARE